MNTTHIEVTTEKGRTVLIPTGMIIVNIIKDDNDPFGEVGFVGSNVTWRTTLDEAMRIRNILMGSQK